MSRFPVAAAAMASVVVLTGCAERTASPPPAKSPGVMAAEQEIADALATYADPRTAGTWCDDALDPGLRRESYKDPFECFDAGESMIGRGGRAVATSFRISGRTALARVRFSLEEGDFAGTVAFRRTTNDWRIDGFRDDLYASYLEGTVLAAVAEARATADVAREEKACLRDRVAALGASRRQAIALPLLLVTEQARKQDFRGRVKPCFGRGAQDADPPQIS